MVAPGVEKAVGGATAAPRLVLPRLTPLSLHPSSVPLGTSKALCFAPVPFRRPSSALSAPPRLAHSNAAPALFDDREGVNEPT